MPMPCPRPTHELEVGAEIWKKISPSPLEAVFCGMLRLKQIPLWHCFVICAETIEPGYHVSLELQVWLEFTLPKQKSEVTIRDNIFASDIYWDLGISREGIGALCVKEQHLSEDRETKIHRERVIPCNLFQAKNEVGVAFTSLIAARSPIIFGWTSNVSHWPSCTFEAGNLPAVHLSVVGRSLSPVYGVYGVCNDERPLESRKWNGRKPSREAVRAPNLVSSETQKMAPRRCRSRAGKFTLVLPVYLMCCDDKSI